MRIGQVFSMAAGICTILAQPVSSQDVSTNPKLLSDGVIVYQEHCAVCHGEDADGNGPLASGFAPRPRDFTRRTFKFRSTELGDFPTEADLRKTLKHGITGSSGQLMPSFSFLTEQETAGVLEVIRYVSGIDTYGTPVAVPPRPTKVDLAQGERLYHDLGCAGCHGDNGNGQGVLSKDLYDEDGLHIRPADFQKGQLKGGNAPEDIWMRIYTGLNGTPMPAFGRNSSAADIWAVTEYVITLRN